MIPPTLSMTCKLITESENVGNRMPPYPAIRAHAGQISGKDFPGKCYTDSSVLSG
jgi:hypothetical protein